MKFRAALLAGLVVLQGAAHAGDPRAGQRTFSTCQTCHTIQKKGPNGIGPNLFGVAGRKAASLPGFYYSSALKASKITWTNDKLKAWIMGPYRLVPGNRMAFAGLSDAKQADDVVAYLDTLK
ncbi:MAG: c-type cytochrome [Alphaproteobacteria bacterium]|nr:c-type cytochrome [Alphaproteobacteria bacterium]